MPPRPATRILAALALVVAASACTKDESNLAKLAEADEQAEAGADAGPSAPEVVKTTEADGADAEGGNAPEPEEPEWELDANGIPIPAQDGPARLLSPGAEDKRVELRLALDEGARYRVTTIGMLQLPLIDRPTGFAREEDVTLSDCEGEGAARTCLATHAYRNYEAEPPAGSGLEADEKQVAGIGTSHRVDASGLRITDTAVVGDASPKIGEMLGQVHRLYCIRLPAEAVGVGAIWKDVCRTRQGGALVTRELTWRLSKLEDTAEGARAELEYAGRVRRVSPKGELINGEIKGALYFWVDAGEPHLMRERMGFMLDAGKGVSTGTDFRFQFAKVVEGGRDGEDELIRTDGKAFEHPPQTLNDPRTVPAGATRDAELPAK
ncbi:hypothetical protein [Enhygromyxa salina]|uniref:hypothetical protein n=1 Tax=Enhygromyxa salina TaxID=215803 RepID=UPI000D094C2F|nr:hypothetical protein [Enhygromyxa salina]